MPARRAGAPRLIDWTGERCVPWAPDVQVVYEHYHRYLWAQQLVHGKRVLDLGSGEGFGAALLADVASGVVGIDIDELTVEHSKLNYGGPELEFRQGSATDLGDFPDDAFEAVVAFEVIEHIADQETVLAEVARLLAPGGLLVMSTPDRRAYSEMTGHTNPFHERELTQSEFRVLLGRRFNNVRVFAQRTATGSRIESLAPTPPPGRLDVHIERHGEDWAVGGPISPLYLIAVASDGEFPELPGGSSLSDFDLALLRQVEHERNQIARELADARRELEVATGERATLVSELTESTSSLDSALDQLAHKQAELSRVQMSVLWRILDAFRRRFYDAVGGRDSPLGRFAGAALRRLGRKAKDVRRVRSWRTLKLPHFETPDVSIVIPVYAGADLTERCLRAILHSTEGLAYEVVIVDDAADADTRGLLRVVQGARVLVNEENLGYLRSVNRGAAAARGRHLILLNNDTEPQPGALRAMVERAESAGDIGIVCAKLVYPDGALQEAGGIVWQDGQPWNFGNGRDATSAEYNYAREVDYGSAAALLVRSELWTATGGFDELYDPGYFEDADLCFTARSLGWRVMYEPKALVVHVEGATMGTDTKSGGKRGQELNQPKFAAKWHAALAEQLPHASWERAYMASNRCRGPCVLVVDHRIPTPDRDAGSLRMWHILQGLQELGCRVTFIPDDFNPIEPYTTDLRGTGVEVLVGPVSVPERVAAIGPRLKLAIVSRPYVAPRYLHVVREHASSALLAYDTVDLHFVREERRMRRLEGGNPHIADGFRELESALVRATDVTLVVSPEERLHLLGVVPEASVELVPLANEIIADAPGPESRSGLLFVGGFQHLPNVDAAHFMATEVMPRVWEKLPDVMLTIVGSNPPPEVMALAGAGIAVPGWVEDLEPLLREQLVMVAPVRYGAGMKGKVTHSLAAGLPLVTTTIGAEGLDVEDGRELLIADDPDQFADRIVRLHSDPGLWLSLSAEGQGLAERICSPAVQKDALKRLLGVRRESASVPSASS